LQPVAGVGLIVAEGTQPSDDGRGYLTAPGMYHARAYRRLEEGDGGHIFIQIMHAGQAKLSRLRYLLGDQLSEADIRRFTTLVRFDAVYHGHFKCNIRRIVDYPALWRFTRDI